MPAHYLKIPDFNAKWYPEEQLSEDGELPEEWRDVIFEDTINNGQRMRVEQLLPNAYGARAAVHGERFRIEIGEDYTRDDTLIVIRIEGAEQLEPEVELKEIVASFRLWPDEEPAGILDSTTATFGDTWGELEGDELEDDAVDKPTHQLCVLLSSLREVLTKPAEELPSDENQSSEEFLRPLRTMWADFDLSRFIYPTRRQGRQLDGTLTPRQITSREKRALYSLFSVELMNRFVSVNKGQCGRFIRVFWVSDVPPLVRERLIDVAVAEIAQVGEQEATVGEPEWPIVGAEVRQINHITDEQISLIRDVLIRDFASTDDPIVPPGGDLGKLQGALARPQTALGNTRKYPTAAMAGAALIHSLVLDHAFFNGNKRTALVTLLVFLNQNNLILESTEDELYELVTDVAAHRLDLTAAGDARGADAEVQSLAHWLHARLRKTDKTQLVLPFRRIRRILNSYGCHISHVQNGVRISRKVGDHERAVHVHYVDEGRTVEKNTIGMIRRELGLDERSGYDSYVFYGQRERIPEFINNYRNALIDLARYDRGEGAARLRGN